MPEMTLEERVQKLEQTVFRLQADLNAVHVILGVFGGRYTMRPDVNAVAFLDEFEAEWTRQINAGVETEIGPISAGDMLDETLRNVRRHVAGMRRQSGIQQQSSQSE